METVSKGSEDEPREKRKDMHPAQSQPSSPHSPETPLPAPHSPSAPSSLPTETGLSPPYPRLPSPRRDPRRLPMLLLPATRNLSGT